MGAGPRSSQGFKWGVSGEAPAAADGAERGEEKGTDKWRRR